MPDKADEAKELIVTLLCGVVVGFIIQLIAWLLG